MTKLLDKYNSLIVGIGPEIRYMYINTLTNKLRRDESNSTSFLKYSKKRIEDLYEDGRYSYASSYKASNKWITEFTKTSDILFKEINH